MDEKDLIQQAKNGDHIAFTKLYNMYVNDISTVIKFLVKDDFTTEVITNDTFLKAYLKLNTYVNNISFRAWLKMIAVNNCIDFFRHAKLDSNNIDIDNEESKVQLSDSICTESEMLHNETRELVNNALNKIPEHKRKALELYYFNNFSYKEIAKLLRMPIGTVKSDINRAKKKLREIIKNPQK
jgi:RNA polymerase sigma factor (sigma-70 family)